MIGFGVRARRRGFTLVEIMIVILIIAMLLAIAIPNFLRARDVSRARACQCNLRQIETAKEQWAMQYRKTGTDTPIPAELVTEYIKGVDDSLPLCPSDGEYSVGNINTRPTCSIATNGDSEPNNDHVLQ